MKNKLMILADLTEKIVLITGSSHGVGAYYADILSKNNATVIVRGRDQEKINNFVEKYKAQMVVFK